MILVRGRIPNHARLWWRVRTWNSNLCHIIIQGRIYFVFLVSYNLLLHEIWKISFNFRLLHHRCLRINHAWLWCWQANHSRLRLKHQWLWLTNLRMIKINRWFLIEFSGQKSNFSFVRFLLCIIFTLRISILLLK